MKPPTTDGIQSTFTLISLKKLIRGVVIGWTLLVAGFVIYEVIDDRNHARELMKTDAHANFNKDQAFRQWAASHGGVYVPITETTQPNPYLTKVAERDIETPSSKKLTLMNPAYMVRQFNEGFKKDYGISGRITSLKLMNPINKPDAWETKALLAFEQGSTEEFEFTGAGDSSCLRLMRPMYIKSSCLKCHSHQGYNVGDVRGGVGVNIATAPYYAKAGVKIIQHSSVLVLLWILGLVGIWFGKNKIRTRIMERDLAIEKIRKLNAELEKKVEQRNEHIESLEQMLFMASHEVRRPVSTCLGLIQMIDREQQPDHLKKPLQMLNTVAEELDSYTRNMAGFVYEKAKKNKARMQ